MSAARRSSGIRRGQVFSGWLFTAPVLVILGLFLLVPVLMAAWVSLSDWSGRGSPLASSVNFIGVDNYSELLTGGGLASYQSDFPAIFRRAATLVDAILKGAKPAEIPFEQATKLELVIDKRAAKAIGVAVPSALLLAADHVIE